MFIKQLYTKCLAQAAYYVESAGESIIIDPLREPEPYLELAKERNTKIKYIFETHFHADFVSGHVELSRQTGAEIVYGPGAKPKYKAIIARDGEKFKVGNIFIEVLHTPGHTLESSCFLLYNEEGKPHCVFTGDTLFIGDVGRPDLLSGNLSKEELAGMLYDSLENKIKTLPNSIMVLPGHGAGSACGKNIGKETVSSIGEQKQNNYALRCSDKKDFINKVTQGLTTPPAYFFMDARINIMGYDSYEVLMNNSSKKLNVDEFFALKRNGAIILDTRSPEEFEKGFIPGSINIGLNGDFAVWAGTLIPTESNIVIVAEAGKEKESIVRLARIGYDNVKGFLEGGISAWKNASLGLDLVKTFNQSDFVFKDDFIILDVRRKGETETCKVKESIFITLSELPEKCKQLNKNRKYAVYCAGGYRSMIAVSILKSEGFNQVYNIKGGMAVLKESVPEYIEY